MSIVALETKQEHAVIEHLLLHQEGMLLKIDWKKTIFKYPNSNVPPFLILFLLKALPEIFWTKELYSLNEKQEFVWFDEKYNGTHEGPAFNYENWAPGYPSNFSVQDQNIGVLINCTNRKSCFWENHDLRRNFATTMCEARLPYTYNFSNETRKAQLKRKIPSHDQQQYIEAKVKSTSNLKSTADRGEKFYVLFVAWNILIYVLL